jgi:hypothetical protein
MSVFRTLYLALKPFIREMKHFVFFVLALGGLFTSQSLQAQMPTKLISSNIEADRFFSNDTIYELNGYIYVKNNATLSIEAGTVIQGYISSTGVNTKGTLIISQDGYIDARGTECSPIVFTSAEDPGQRSAGDWGGLVLLGSATLNSGTNMGGYFTDIMEGGLVGNVADRTYGGADDADSSGVLQYVRIEFAGIALQPNEEINALTLAGVGTSTFLDHIMISYSGDDAIEIFGGEARMSHIVTHSTTDDDFDYDQGARGNVQFAILYKEASTADVSLSEAIESDNDGNSPNLLPRTAPIIANITIVGPKATGTPDANHQSAARIRRGSWTSIHNSVFVDHLNGLFIGGAESFTGWNNGMEFKGNVMAGMTNNYKTSGSHSIGAMDTLWSVSNTNYPSTSSIGLDSNYNNISNPNLNPVSGSVLLSGADWNFTGNEEFAQVSYRGAMDESTDWTNGWTEWNPQNVVYDSYPPVLDSVNPVNQNKGVFRAYFQALPPADSYEIQFREEGDTNWTSKTIRESTQTNQRFNVTPIYNSNVEVRLAAETNGIWLYSCTQTFFNDCRDLAIQLSEQEDAFCAGDSSLLRVGIAGGYGNKTISWSNGSGSKRTYAQQGEKLYVTVTDASGCSVTDSITASIIDASTAPNNFTLDRLGPTIYQGSWSPSQLDMGSSLIGYRMAYRLRGTNNLTYTSLTTDTFITVDFTGTGLPAGNYEFVAFARYNNGTSNTNSNFTCIEAKGYNGSGNKGAEFITASGETSAFAIYPNPTSGEVFINAMEGSTIRLTDVNGRSLIQTKLHTSETNIDMSHLACGAYFIYVTNGNQSVTTKVIKQ